MNHAGREEKFRRSQQGGKGKGTKKPNAFVRMQGRKGIIFFARGKGGKGG